MITLSISSYNQQEFLPDAVESALNQTVPCEIIVIDDGSQDHSLEIARSYPVRVISQVNKGLSSTRNTGLMNCNTDYIIYLDADDKLDPNTIERIEQVIKETNADIVSPSMQCFGLSNAVVILMPNPTIEDFKTGNRIAYCSAIRKSKLLEIGGYSPRMHTGYEDYHLWFNLLYRGAKIVTIPETLFWYRTKENSMWHDAVKHHEELMAQIRKDFPEVTNIINDPLPR